MKPGENPEAVPPVAGIHVRRLREDNPREVAMIEQWQKEHERSDLLDLLMRVRCEPSDPDAFRLAGTQDWYRMPLGSPTERDRAVVATVIQWLGSNVGMGFLQNALNRCGYDIR